MARIVPSETLNFHLTGYTQTSISLDTGYARIVGYTTEVADVQIVRERTRRHGRQPMSGWVAIVTLIVALGGLGVAAALLGVDSRDGCDNAWW